MNARSVNNSIGWNSSLCKANISLLWEARGEQLRERSKRLGHMKSLRKGMKDFEIWAREPRVMCYGVKHHFQQYFSYIVAASFTGGGNQGTWRKPLRHME